VNVVVDFRQESNACNRGRAQRIHEGFKTKQDHIAQA
jgi:hypothetical protein